MRFPTNPALLLPDGGGAFVHEGPVGGGGAFGGAGNPCCNGPELLPGTKLEPLDADGTLLPFHHFPMLLPAEFPRRLWGAEFWATTIVTEFAATPWARTVTVGPPPDCPDTIRDEIYQLLLLAKDRSTFSAEIVAQATNPLPYWLNLLNITAASHPATWQAILAANECGHVVAMHYKRSFARPRPVQHYPALMPPLHTPAHPSYPSGHALEAMTVARIVEHIYPALAQAKPPTRGPADALARRIALNREIAGVHFESDSKAGFILADLLAPHLLTVPSFAATVAAAQAEWGTIPTHTFDPPTEGLKDTKALTEDLRIPLKITR